MLPGLPPPLFVVLASEESSQVMSNQIVEAASLQYATQNAFFASYLYGQKDICGYLLESWSIEGMWKAGDSVQNQRVCFKKVDPNLNNCPIILANLTYPMFSNYLSM